MTKKDRENIHNKLTVQNYKDIYFQALIFLLFINIKSFL